MQPAFTMRISIKIRNIAWSDTRFLIFLAGINLNKAGQLTPLFFHLIRQNPRQFLTIERFNHIE